MSRQKPIKRYLNTFNCFYHLNNDFSVVNFAAGYFSNGLGWKKYQKSRSLSFSKFGQALRRIYFLCTFGSICLGLLLIHSSISPLADLLFLS